MDTAGTPYEWRVSSEAGKGWMSRMRQLHAQRAAGSHQKRVVAAPVEHSHLPLAVSPHDALNAKEWVPTACQRDDGSKAHLDSTLTPCDGKGTAIVWRASGGRPGRNRYRGACLGKNGTNSQILTTYVWNKSRTRTQTSNTQSQNGEYTIHLVNTKVTAQQYVLA